LASVFTMSVANQMGVVGVGSKFFSALGSGSGCPSQIYPIMFLGQHSTLNVYLNPGASISIGE